MHHTPYHLRYTVLYHYPAKAMILDRITLDIDYYERNFRLKALKAYHGLEALDFVDEVIVHISTSGRGLHIQGHLSEVLDDNERFALRRSLNDDDKRADLDEQRGAVGHATDIYWDEKEGNEMEREEFEDICTALDRLEKTRAPDVSRVKALAQHGCKGVHDQHGLNRASKGEPTEERAHR